MLEISNLSKRYGDLLANDGIDLLIEPGEIHALLGENGAGKSTLVKILYGVVEPTAGEILWEGRPVTFASPMQARALGLGGRKGDPEDFGRVIAFLCSTSAAFVSGVALQVDGASTLGLL